MKQFNKSQGFTLIEIIISLSLFVILMLLVNTMYDLSQTTYNKNSDTAELTQNVRVTLDRLSRELRQSEIIVTALPPTNTDANNPPASQIFFQDGHDTSQITYILYQLNGTYLERTQKAYYFSSAPSSYVTYNSLDQNNNPPQELIISNQVVGEYFKQLQFWGSSGLVNISIQLLKNKNSFNLNASVYSRNH